MEIIGKFGEGFSRIINAGGDNLIALIVGLLPAVLITLTFINTIVKFIGEQKVYDTISRIARKNALFRYTIMPVVAVFFFPTPTQFLVGKYLPERHKTAFFEAVNCLAMSPMVSFFPHVNAGEAIVFLGIAQGVEKAGYSTIPLATATLLVGIVSTSFRSFVVGRVNAFLAKKKGIDWEMVEARKKGRGETV